MKLFKIGMMGLLIGGLLAGCGTEEAKPKEAEQKVNAETEVKAATIDPKAWKDLSTAGDLEKTGFPTSVKEWVPATLDVLSQPADSKLIEAGLDEGYDMYLKADSISNVLGGYIRVEGIDLEKDFENLRALTSIIGHEQFVRTAHIDPNGYAKKKIEAVKDWKPTSERTKKAFEYMKQLLNDIDVAINQDGQGETFGVSHQLDGEKVEALENWIECDNEEECVYPLN